MNSQIRSPFEIRKAIDTSAGMRFINREHGRSFSLNIFRTNSRELIEALRHVSDPEHCLRLMSVDNKEAGTQAHREVSRRIHNFVAAAKTLVDQTRVFMKANYDKSSIFRVYNEEITRVFSENKIVKFVHDLRNYILHCGLPNSTMFIQYSQDPEQPDQAPQLLTGVRLDTQELKNWTGWTKPARAYLNIVGERVPLEELVKSYVLLVEKFQSWLSEQLVNFHVEDMVELDELRDAYALSENKPEGMHEAKKIEEDITPNLSNVATDTFSLPSSTATEINRMGDELLTEICKLNFAPAEQVPFKSNRPIGMTITPDDCVEQPILWREDADGNLVLAFILRQSAVYGFDNKSLSKLQQIIEAVLCVGWAEQSLSEKFVEKIIIHWCRSAFGSATPIKLAETITAASLTEVKSVEFWAPIAHLEIESGFSFGFVHILPITVEMINKLEVDALKSASRQETQIHKLFKELRSRMQGYASVVVKLQMVNDRAGIEGLAIAREALSLLRFFSPAAADTSIFCPISLLGNEAVPNSHVLVLGDGSFSYSNGLLPNNLVNWQISKERLKELQHVFEAAGSLIQIERLDEFERAIRTGMILFGTAAIFIEPSDRLIYTLSAMEGVLLKHELEAAAYSVEERMALLLANEDVDSDKVTRCVRAVYRLKARHGLLQWSDFNRDILQEFVQYSERVLMIALQNLANFSTRVEFIEAIERTIRA